MRLSELPGPTLYKPTVFTVDTISALEVGKAEHNAAIDTLNAEMEALTNATNVEFDAVNAEIDTAIEVIEAEFKMVNAPAMARKLTAEKLAQAAFDAAQRAYDAAKQAARAAYEAEAGEAITARSLALGAANKAHKEKVRRIRRGYEDAKADHFRKFKQIENTIRVALNRQAVTVTHTARLQVR